MRLNLTFIVKLSLRQLTSDLVYHVIWYSYLLSFFSSFSTRIIYAKTTAFLLKFHRIIVYLYARVSAVFFFFFLVTKM